jgi:hypothetical protein
VPLIDYLTELENTPGSATDIATAVWTSVLRTLTADPATDAGAANLTWTNASRALTIDPATDAGLATLVWTHSPRSLTGLGGGAIVAANAISQSVAAGVLVDLRPAASNFRFGMFGKVGGVSTSWAIGHYDGVTFRPEASVASLAAGFIPAMIGSNSFGFAVQNTGTISDVFNFSGFDWTQ